MPVTLAEAKLNVQDDLQMGIIDEFAKSNFILNAIPFHDCVSPTGGGGTMTYAYTRLKTQPTAAFRKINADYTPQEVERERHTVDLKVLGGSFQIDRVIAEMGGIVDEVSLQASQKVKAVQATFNDCFINGDSSQREDEFDGIDVALTGSSTEYNASGSVIDLSSAASVTANYQQFLDMLDEFLSGMDGTPTALLMNTSLRNKMRAVARRAGMYQVSKDTWGNQVEFYGDIPMIDMGAKSGSNTDVIGSAASGDKTATSLYAVRLGMDGVHGISLAGVAPVKLWLPDYQRVETVQAGSVEMVTAIAVKNSRSAGVFRNIAIA